MLWLIGLIIFIIIAAVLFFVLKKVVKVILILVGLIILVLVVGLFFIYQDARSMQENFDSSPNLFLLEIEENIIAGMQSNPEQDPVYLDSQTISSYNFLYKDNNLNDIKEDNYKLIIFNQEAFDSIQQITIDNHIFTYEFATALLNSNTPVDDYIDNLIILEGISQENRESVKQNMKSDFEYSDTEFKGAVFATLFQERQDAEGPIFIFKQYQAGNAEVYKETAIFKLIEVIPTSFLKNMIEKTKTTVKETVKSKINNT